MPLGKSGDEMLVEYRMPGGTTALRIVNVYGNPSLLPEKIKNVSYKDDTWHDSYYFAFLENAALNGYEWTGFPAYSRSGRRPASLKRTYAQALVYHRQVQDDQRQHSQSAKAQPRAVRTRRNYPVEQRRVEKGD
jgi:hypothetical protein